MELQRNWLATFFFLACFLHPIRSDDASTQLLQGINKYRASLNLSSLTDNQNADCLAEQLALQFKGQQCSNSSGSDTVPGTEQSFPSYPDFLNKCHLNVTVTQDGQVMPVCVPGLVSDVVLSNYTQTQYNEFLNDSSYVGIGMADEGNWMVVVLTTNTPTGNYAPATATASAALCVAVDAQRHLLMLLLGLFMILIL